MSYILRWWKRQRVKTQFMRRIRSVERQNGTFSFVCFFFNFFWWRRNAKWVEKRMPNNICTVPRAMEQKGGAATIMVDTLPRRTASMVLQPRRQWPDHGKTVFHGEGVAMDHALPRRLLIPWAASICPTLRSTDDSTSPWRKFCKMYWIYCNCFVVYLVDCKLTVVIIQFCCPE